MRAYIDSDIIIWHLRGEKKAAKLLSKLFSDTETEVWMGAMQRAEVTFHLRPGEEAPTFHVLSRIKTHPVTQPIVDRGGQFYRQWHPSHRLDENDAVLAATVEITGGRLYTLNAKHFPMPHIVVIKGW